MSDKNYKYNKLVPFQALSWFVFQGIFFILIVFGTYGTFEGGLEQTAQSYLKPAFIFITMLFMALSARQAWFNDSKISYWIFHEPVGLLLIAYFLIMLLGLFVVPEKITGVFATIAATIATLVYVTNRATSRITFLSTFWFLNWLIYFSSVIAFLAGAYSYWIDSFKVGPLLIEYNQTFWRVNSWFMTSTGFGFFLGLGVISASYHFGRTSSATLKIVHTAVIVGLVIGMFLSGARSSLSALVVAWLLYLVTRFGLRVQYLLSILSIFILVIGIRMVPDDLSQEILVVRRFTDQDDTATLGGRTEMWNEAMEIFSNEPLLMNLFGSGFGTFSETLGWDIGAHSGFLRVAIEHGFLGFITVLSIFVLTLLVLIKEVKSSEKIDLELRSLFLYFIIFLVGEVVLPQLFGISMEYIIFLSIVSLIYSRTRRGVRVSHGE